MNRTSSREHGPLVRRRAAARCANDNRPLRMLQGVTTSLSEAVLRPEVQGGGVRGVLNSSTQSYSDLSSHAPKSPALPWTVTVGK